MRQLSSEDRWLCHYDDGLCQLDKCSRPEKYWLLYRIPGEKYGLLHYKAVCGFHVAEQKKTAVQAGLQEVEVRNLGEWRSKAKRIIGNTYKLGTQQSVKILALTKGGRAGQSRLRVLQMPKGRDEWDNVVRTEAVMCDIESGRYKLLKAKKTARKEKKR